MNLLFCVKEASLKASLCVWRGDGKKMLLWNKVRQVKFDTEFITKSKNYGIMCVL